MLIIRNDPISQNKHNKRLKNNKKLNSKRINSAYRDSKAVCWGTFPTRTKIINKCLCETRKPWREQNGGKTDGGNYNIFLKY